jgi:hypothetical protein
MGLTWKCWYAVKFREGVEIQVLPYYEPKDKKPWTRNPRSNSLGYELRRWRQISPSEAELDLREAMLQAAKDKEMALEIILADDFQPNPESIRKGDEALAKILASTKGE